MPNFTTHDVIEEVDSQKSSVISHWDQLSGQQLLHEDPDEVFSEMRPAAASSEATTEANVPKGMNSVAPRSSSCRFPLLPARLQKI